MKYIFGFFKSAVSRLMFLNPDLETNVMGHNWWLLFWWISALLTCCPRTIYTDTQITKEFFFVENQSWEAPPDFTWFLWVFISAHWYPEASSVLDSWFQTVQDKLGDSSALSSASFLVMNGSLSSWDYNYSGDLFFARSFM